MVKIRYVPTPTVCTVFASKSRRTDTLVSFSQVITGASVLTNVWILSANIYSWKELSKFYKLHAKTDYKVKHKSN